MEIDITEFFNNADPSYYSASAFELGQDAGRITWQNAKDSTKEYTFLDNQDKLDCFRDWIKSCGFSEAEAETVNDEELNALFIQWISGDIRELEDTANAIWDSVEFWEEIQQLQEQGTIAGNIFKGIDSKVYFGLY